MASNGSAIAPTKGGDSMITTASIIISILFPIISLIAIVLRVRARRLGQLKLEADDWGMIVTWIGTLSLSIVLWVLAAHSGIDHYTTDKLAGDMDAAKLLLLSSSMAEFPLASVKISILLFYKRIFVTKRMALAVWILIPLVAAWGLIFFFIILFQGKPVSAAWTGLGILQFDTVKVGLALCGSSMALDILVLCLPIPVILGLHMNTQRKIAVIGMFSLGLFCVVVAAIRLYFLQAATQQAIDSAKSGQGFNAIALEAKLFIFVLLEPNSSIIAGCLPCYGSFFAGGRGLTSILNSIRSVISLRSVRSTNDPASGGSWGRRSVLNTNGTGKRSTDSDAELRDRSAGWTKINQSKGSNDTTAEYKRYRQVRRGDPSAINVTKNVDVDVSSV